MKVEEPDERRADREMALELRRLADRICFLILSTDYPEIDIEIEKTELRQRCRELFPDRMDLYEMIYESRFRRLWQQFREDTSKDDLSAW